MRNNIQYKKASLLSIKIVEYFVQKKEEKTICIRWDRITFAMASHSQNGISLTRCERASACMNGFNHNWVYEKAKNSIKILGYQRIVYQL